MAYEKNEWLQLNKKNIERLQYKLTEEAYKNEHTGLPIPEIRGMIGAAVIEIKKLKGKIDELVTTVNKLQPKVEVAKK